MIDFREAQIQDPQWWRRCNILIDDLSRDDDERLLTAAYRFHLALVANSNLTEDSWKTCKKHALDTLNDLINAIHPWGALAGEQRKNAEIQELKDLYKAQIGDMDDPEFQKVIANEVSRMMTEVVKPAESDEQRIDRLFRERLIGST